MPISAAVHYRGKSKPWSVSWMKREPSSRSPTGSTGCTAMGKPMRTVQRWRDGWRRWCNGWRKGNHPFKLAHHPKPCRATALHGLPLRELEALASPFLAVFLSFLHSAITGQVAGVAQLLGHAADGILFGGLSRQSEHRLEGAGNPLGNSAALPRESASPHIGEHVQPIAHLGQFQRPDNGGAVFVFSEVVHKFAAVDHQLSRAFADPDAGNRSLAAAGTEIIRLFRFHFRHGHSPNQDRGFNSCGCWAW